MDKELKEFFEGGPQTEATPKIRAAIEESRKRLERRANRMTRKGVSESSLPRLFEGISPIQVDNNVDMSEYSVNDFGVSKRDLHDLTIFSSYQDNLLPTLALYHGTRVLSDTNRLIRHTEFGKDIFSEMLRRMRVRRRIDFVIGAGIYKMNVLSDFHGLFGVRENFGLNVRKLRGLNLEGVFVYLTGLGDRLNVPLASEFPKIVKDERDMFNELDSKYREKIISYLGNNFPFMVLGKERYPDPRVLWNSRAGSFSQVKEHPGKKYAESALMFFEARELI